MSPPALAVAPVSRFRFVAFEVESVVVWLRSASTVAGKLNASTGTIRRNRSACFIFLSPPMSRTPLRISAQAVIGHRKATNERWLYVVIMGIERRFFQRVQQKHRLS